MGTDLQDHQIQPLTNVFPSQLKQFFVCPGLNACPFLHLQVPLLMELINHSIPHSSPVCARTQNLHKILICLQSFCQQRFVLQINGCYTAHSHKLQLLTSCLAGNGWRIPTKLIMRCQWVDVEATSAGLISCADLVYWQGRV